MGWRAAHAERFELALEDEMLARLLALPPGEMLDALAALMAARPYRCVDPAAMATAETGAAGLVLDRILADPVLASALHARLAAAVPEPVPPQ